MASGSPYGACSWAHRWLECAECLCGGLTCPFVLATIEHLRDPSQNSYQGPTQQTQLTMGATVPALLHGRSKRKTEAAIRRAEVAGRHGDERDMGATGEGQNEMEARQ